MKKLVICLLAAALLLGLPATAMAEGEVTPMPPTLSYYDWLYTWSEENPDIVEEILRDEPPLWAEYGFASLEELLEYWGMTEEEYYYDYVLYERAWEYYYIDYESYYAKWVGDMREFLGAPRTGLAVMVNNKYISFPDAQPELSNDRTMLPIRALLEALGASVDFAAQGGVVTAELRGVNFSFAVGESEITVTEDGVSRTIQMDCNTYIKNDRTYVPVRFFSEAAGFDVLWDGDFQTAVILDREAILADLNRSFTVMNKLCAMNRRDPSRTYKTVADVSAAITSFSTLDGNISGRVNLKATLLSNGQTQNLVLNCDLSGIMNLLTQRAGLVLGDDELAIVSSMSNIYVEIIIDSDEQVSYVKFPALTDALGYGGDTWLRIYGDILSDGSVVAGDMGSLFGGADSVGASIYKEVVSGYYYETGVMSCNAMYQLAEEMERYYGDSLFTKSGNSWSASFDKDDYEMLVYGVIPGEDSYYDYKELDIRLTITDSGGRIGASGSFTVRENNLGYGNETRTTGTFSMSSDYINASFTIHTDNTSKTDIELRMTVSEVTQNVVAAPPPGSVIVDG